MQTQTITILHANSHTTGQSKEMTKKMLCAVDDTEHSKSAVAVAGQLATATGAGLTLLAVSVPIGVPASYQR